MIDVPLTILAWLRNQPSIVAAFGGRIYAESAYPEAGYSPSQGACLCFRVRGGTYGLPPNGLLHQPSVQFKIYPSDTQLADPQADSLWRVVHDALQIADCTCGIWWARLETAPTTQRETGGTPNWTYKLAYYTIALIEGATPCPC